LIIAEALAAAELLVAMMRMLQRDNMVVGSYGEVKRNEKSATENEMLFSSFFMLIISSISRMPDKIKLNILNISLQPGLAEPPEPTVHTGSPGKMSLKCFFRLKRWGV
jgi:hypothetical protein